MTLQESLNLVKTTEVEQNQIEPNYGVVLRNAFIFRPLISAMFEAKSDEFNASRVKRFNAVI
jgi:hypothetical protein